LLRLLIWHQLKSGGYGLGSGAYPFTLWTGNFWLGLPRLGQEATVNCLRQ
jgi:hypothetical protein